MPPAKQFTRIIPPLTTTPQKRYESHPIWQMKKLSHRDVRAISSKVTLPENEGVGFKSSSHLT